MSFIHLNSLYFTFRLYLQSFNLLLLFIKLLIYFPVQLLSGYIYYISQFLKLIYPFQIIYFYTSFILRVYPFLFLPLNFFHSIYFFLIHLILAVPVSS
jgi:hypothetical protein